MSLLQAVSVLAPNTKLYFHCSVSPHALLQPLGKSRINREIIHVSEELRCTWEGGQKGITRFADTGTMDSLPQSKTLQQQTQQHLASCPGESVMSKWEICMKRWKQQHLALIKNFNGSWMMKPKVFGLYMLGHLIIINNWFLKRSSKKVKLFSTWQNRAGTQEKVSQHPNISRKAFANCKQ